jgi:acyl carrier protein
MNELEQLKIDLKLMIIDACEKEQSVEDISNEEVLFGEDAPLQLDSMDALQISMAISSTYGIKMTDSKKLRNVMESINTLAIFVSENKK